jgi:hypothetical protein
MIKSTKPDELVLPMMSVWSRMPVMGKVLLPGTKVISLMVLLPTTPFWAVDRESVTFPCFN